MGFSNRCWWGVVIVLLCAGCIAEASETDSHITVLVNDSAGVRPAVLRHAEIEAGRVFQKAGIEIDWVNCMGEDQPGECRHVPGDNIFVLHIVPNGLSASDSVFGVAFLGEDGTGKYTDVFFDRIERLDLGADVNTARLLGTVSAHELGHLLLGSNAHSRIGIMEPIWQRGILRQVGMGTLLFTREQAELMRRRTGSEKAKFSLVAGRTRRPVE